MRDRRKASGVLQNLCRAKLDATKDRALFLAVENNLTGDNASDEKLKNEAEKKREIM